MATNDTPPRPPRQRDATPPPADVADPLLDPATYAYADRQCDIVMKGGIASGVVYPRGICELARDYRFRSIGGTSVGAVAAALAAAAELGRSRGRPGFPELASLGEWLGRPAAEGGPSRLAAMIRPQPATAPIYRALAAASGRAGARALRLLVAAVQGFPVGALLGALPGLALAALALGAGAGWLGALFALVGLGLAGAGGAAGAALALVRRIGREVPANFYGLCNGMNGASPDGPLALTPWLAGLLDSLAGQPEGRPLTFGDLWRDEHRPDPGDGIDLRFMTTSLTHGRPYQVPFEGIDLYFHPGEMRKLFPEAIVRWMEEHAPQADAAGDREAPAGAERRALERRAAGAAGLRPLPAARDLPVVVGARLSLSFPMLISAVPLWTFYPRDETVTPERAWFSDGGICSNFPVHFFDSALPSRPTFAINLRPFPPGQEPSLDDEARNFWTPGSNHDVEEESWARFDRQSGLRSLLGFVGAGLDAGLDWVDNSQIKVPGYRDRVVHVKLAGDEGGLNLDMPHDVITRLGRRGQAAAAKLAARFGPAGDGTELTWDNHRWVRYRSTMGVLETMLRQMRSRYRAETGNHRTYPALIRRRDDPPEGYRWAIEVQERADDLTTRLMEIEFLDDQAPPFFSAGAPEPVPQLRIVPRI